MALAKQAEERVGRFLTRLTIRLAYGGGIILALMSIITVVSVIGRRLLGIEIGPFTLGPVKGDFELIEAGCAIAIFAFLPLTQMRRGHVTVDVFIQALPQRVVCFLGLVGDTLIAIGSVVILWRFFIGFGEKLPYGSTALRSFFGFGAKPFFPETTYELELPIWIPYGLALFGAAIFALVSLYTVWRALNWTLDGQEQML